MKNILIFFLLTLGKASCQTVQSDLISQCIFESSFNREIASPKSLLVTPIFEKDDKGIFAYRIKGPHSVNRLAFKEEGSCKIIPSDSTSQFLKDEVKRFIERHRLSKRQKKQIQKKLQGHILDFKDSNYID